MLHYYKVSMLRPSSLGSVVSVINSDVRRRVYSRSRASWECRHLGGPIRKYSHLSPKDTLRYSMLGSYLKSASKML